MSRRQESNAELLLKLPWYVTASIGVVAFIGLRWLVPIWSGHDPNPIRQMVAQVAHNLAPVVLLLFAVFSAGSFWLGRRHRRLLDGQTDIESIRALSWKEFEFLVAEAYRRQGYQVEYSLGRGADGGVDLTLSRHGQTSLVQCKQWKVFSVGVSVIREMFGLMHDQHANEVIIVTSGKFTPDAREFAAGKPIQLIDGPQLLALIKTVQMRSVQNPSAAPGPGSTSNQPPSAVVDAVAACPCCPSCGQPMVLRTSKRGANAGTQFWGCSTYPTCQGTRKLGT